MIRGDLADEGVDYYETFSPVARWETVRTCNWFQTIAGGQLSRIN